MLCDYTGSIPKHGCKSGKFPKGENEFLQVEKIKRSARSYFYLPKVF